MSDRAPRPDAARKVLGTGLYTDDIRLEGMVHAKALRSAYPRAVVDALDVSRARAHPDCLAVLTAADVPENVIGHLVDDWDVLVAEGATTRYVGDALALVVCAHEAASTRCSGWSTSGTPSSSRSPARSRRWRPAHPCSTRTATC